VSRSYIPQLSRFLTLHNEEDTSRDDEKVDDSLKEVAPVPGNLSMRLCKCTCRVLPKENGIKIGVKQGQYLLSIPSHPIHFIPNQK